MMSEWNGDWEGDSNRACSSLLELFSFFLFFLGNMGRFSFHQNPGSCRLLNFRELPVANRAAFSKISIKEDNLAWYTQIFEKFCRKFFFRATLYVKISRNFGWVVRISKIQPFPGFLKLFREISVPFAAVSKVSKVLVEWKAPMVYACCTVFPGHFLRKKPSERALRNSR